MARREGYWKEWYWRNRERRLVQKRSERLRNAERIRNYDRLYHDKTGRVLKRKRHAAKREQFANRPRPVACEICAVLGPVQYDHCHDSGKFRGWLCGKCNKMLGFGGDNVKTLLAAIEYLVAFDSRSAVQLS